MLPTSMPRLADDCVVLRAFEDRDVVLVRSVASDPLIPLITTVPASGSEADALAFIARQHERLRTGAGYSFVIENVATGQAVGQVGLWLRDIDQGRASTGYWVAEQRRGRGHTTAALALVTQWALTLDGIHRVQLYVEPWNEGSWRAAERCGYRREGLLRSWQQIGDERKDMYGYAITRDDLAGERP